MTMECEYFNFVTFAHDDDDDNNNTYILFVVYYCNDRLGFYLQL